MRLIPRPHDVDRVAEAGVDTRRLAQSEVLICVGKALRSAELCGHPVDALCRALMPLGFRAVSLCGGEEFFGELVVDTEGGLQHFPGDGSAETLACLAASADVVVDLDSDDDGRPESGRAATERPSLGLRFRWGDAWAAMWSAPQSDLCRLDSAAPTPATGTSTAPIARIVAGLALQEIVIHTGRIAAACPPARCIAYDAGTESRGWEGEQGIGGMTQFGIEHAIIDVVGAGAVGAHLLECLVPLLANSELRIFDPDVVAPENLSLSAMYDADDVGRSKAVAAASRLTVKAGHDVSIHPFPTRYEEQPRSLRPPSLRIACVDTFAARNYLNDLSLGDGVPLTEAGSSPLAGQVRTYLAGRTACLAHRIPRLAQKAASEKDSASCLQNPAPTLPGVNMVVAGMQALEAVRTLWSPDAGGPSLGTIVYDCREPRRIGVTGVRAPCVHETCRASGPL